MGNSNTVEEQIIVDEDGTAEQVYSKEVKYHQRIDDILNNIQEKLRVAMKDIDGVSINDARALCKKVVVINTEVLNREFPVKVVQDMRHRIGISAPVTSSCDIYADIGKSRVNPNPQTACDYKKLACRNIVEFLQQKVLLINYVEENYKFCKEQEEVLRSGLLQKRENEELTVKEYGKASRILSDYNKYLIEKYAELDFLLEQVEKNMTVAEIKELRNEVMNHIERMNDRCRRYSSELQNILFLPLVGHTSTIEKRKARQMGCAMNDPLQPFEISTLRQEYDLQGLNLNGARICNQVDGKFQIVNNEGSEIIRIPIADFDSIRRRNLTMKKIHRDNDMEEIEEEMASQNLGYIPVSTRRVPTTTRRTAAPKSILKTTGRTPPVEDDNYSRFERRLNAAASRRRRREARSTRKEPTEESDIARRIRNFDSRRLPSRAATRRATTRSPKVTFGTDERLRGAANIEPLNPLFETNKTARLVKTQKPSQRFTTMFQNPPATAFNN
jgi:hypothetical protein